jgi:hypothetical protein
MAEKPEPQSWWHTLPGILTATAGIITAITGLIIALNQVGYFKKDETRPSTENNIFTPNHPAEKASNDEHQAPTPNIDTPLPKPNPHTETKSEAQQKRINLLAPGNGVQLLAASSDEWKFTIDEKEDWIYLNGMDKETVYGFKDEQAATFDTFTMLISEASEYNVKDFELLVGNVSPTSNFESIGKFQTQHLKLFKTPYQAFTFPVVTAKYLKVKLINTHDDRSSKGVREFQLFGELK